MPSETQVEIVVPIDIELRPAATEPPAASHDLRISRKELHRLHALASGNDGGTLLGIAAANALLLHEIAEHLLHAEGGSGAARRADPTPELKKLETDFETKITSLSTQIQRLADNVDHVRTHCDRLASDSQQLTRRHEAFTSEFTELREKYQLIETRLVTVDQTLSGSESQKETHTQTARQGSAKSTFRK